MTAANGDVYWLKHQIGDATRYRLYHKGLKTPWFISRGPSYDRPSYDKRLAYRVSGSGMDSSGCAGQFGWFRTLAEAKAKILELAALEARPAERCVMGNVVFLVGDRVRFREHGSAFFPCGRRFGRIVALSTGFLASVLWDDEEAPSLQYLPWLISDELEAAA